MAYEDLLKMFQTFHQTRLFDNKWKTAQKWTSLAIPWKVDYLKTKFSFTLEKPAPVVVVLSQVSNHTLLIRFVG